MKARRSTGPGGPVWQMRQSREHFNKRWIHESIAACARSKKCPFERSTVQYDLTLSEA